MRFSRDNNPRPDRLPGNGLGNRTAQKPPDTPIKRPEQTQILNPNRVGCSASSSRTKLGQVQKLCMRVTAHFPPQTARPFQNTPQRQTSTHQIESAGENKHPRHRPRPQTPTSRHQRGETGPGVPGLPAGPDRLRGRWLSRWNRWLVTGHTVG